MSQGFGIAALFLAVMSFVIPVLGPFTTMLAMLFGLLAALAGDRVLAAIVGVLGLANLFFINLTFLHNLTVTAEARLTSAFFFHIMVLLSPTFPFIGIVLNIVNESNKATDIRTRNENARR